MGLDASGSCGFVVFVAARVSRLAGARNGSGAWFRRGDGASPISASVSWTACCDVLVAVVTPSTSAGPCWRVAK
jgi:hypothetical protein